MSKGYYDFRVVGLEEDVRVFYRMLLYMNKLATSGSSRTFTVSSDGDGSTIKFCDLDGNLLEHPDVKFNLEKPQHFDIGE